MLSDYRTWLESELKLLGNASHHAYSFGQANMAKRAIERLDQEVGERLILALERAEPSLAERLDPRLPYTGAVVVYAARAEHARTVDDVLARRTRALFTDVAAARASAPLVAQLLARERGRDDEWRRDQCAAFGAIAREDAAAFA